MDPAALASRVRSAYLGLVIADSLSMPVHWYYNPGHITRDFGRITTFQAPRPSHPSSIMQLSNTGGAGRGAQSGSIIGDVINHGKKQFWGVANMHYHQGMKAGENTLNAIVARLLVRELSTPPATAAALLPYSAAPFLSAYVSFMQTPGSHNDTYAETGASATPPPEAPRRRFPSFRPPSPLTPPLTPPPSPSPAHRMFFKNLVAGKDPSACADNDGHNVDSAGGLVLLPPPALLAACAGAAVGGASAEGRLAAARAAARQAAVAQMYATHNSKRLEGFVALYAEALASVLMSTRPPAEALREAASAAGSAMGLDFQKLVAQGKADTDVVGGTFTSACYIEGSLPSLFYLATKYADSPREALIANTNVGGENCHRVRVWGKLPNPFLLPLPTSLPALPPSCPSSPAHQPQHRATLFAALQP
jgi:ADP-ribosyl-[dinitrogen reductase] hydrolase